MSRSTAPDLHTCVISSLGPTLGHSELVKVNQIIFKLAVSKLAPDLIKNDVSLKITLQTIQS